MTTVQDTYRYPLPWPYELHAGTVARTPGADHLRQRLAARIARALAPVAQTAGAWVSSEALVRLERDPDTTLRPPVVVAGGDVPYDGVVDDGVLLVVELDERRLDVWREAGVGVVWLPRSRSVVVAAGDTARVVGPDATLRLPGGTAGGVAAADLCRLAAVTG